MVLHSRNGLIQTHFFEREVIMAQFAVIDADGHARMHAYVVVKMAEVLETKDLILLAQQAADEARHFQAAGE